MQPHSKSVKQILCELLGEFMEDFAQGAEDIADIVHYCASRCPEWLITTLLLVALVALYSLPWITQASQP